MRNYMLAGLAVAGVAAFAAPLLAEPEVAAAAPNFRAYDMNGKVVELAQYRGKTVVLEWNNPGCPYVKKHYDSGNMQKTQAAATRQGAVWLTINSGAPGKQGHMTGPEAKQFVAAQKAAPTSYVLDPKGLIGKVYGAKTTPHLYIVDPAGRLVYKGGIDDQATADAADIAKARNHVLAALGELRSGKPVSVPETRPYGCSVKYAS